MVPSDGGFLHVDGEGVKYRGNDGTVTTIVPVAAVAGEAPLIVTWYGLHVGGPAAENPRAVLEGLHTVAFSCPCGVTVVYANGKQIPPTTTPHPCGHPRHFTVWIG